MCGSAQLPRAGLTRPQRRRLLKDDEDEALTLILASYIHDADLAKDAAFAFMFANDADCEVVDGFRISADLRRRLVGFGFRFFQSASNLRLSQPSAGKVVYPGW